MIPLDIKLNILPKRLQSFLTSQYGKDNVLLINYTGSSVIEGVRKPKDTDILVLVTDRKATRLPALPEWIVGGEDYDADYIIRYNASWVAEDAMVTYWDVLVMDDLPKYVSWLIATQLAISINITDKAARKKLFNAVITMETVKSEGQQLLLHRLTEKHNTYI